MSVCMCARVCIIARTRGHRLPTVRDVEAGGGDYWTDAKRLRYASVTDIIPGRPRRRGSCCATYT